MVLVLSSLFHFSLARIFFFLERNLADRFLSSSSFRNIRVNQGHYTLGVKRSCCCEVVKKTFWKIMPCRQSNQQTGMKVKLLIRCSIFMDLIQTIACTKFSNDLFISPDCLRLRPRFCGSARGFLTFALFAPFSRNTAVVFFCLPHSSLKQPKCHF